MTCQTAALGMTSARFATTNVIERPQSGAARRTANVARWRDREMVERWV